MTDPAPDPGLVAAVRLTGQLQGLDLELALDLDVRRLPRLVAYLQRIGFQGRPRPVPWQTTPDGLPICPRHGAPMKLREKQGDTWHSHKLVTDSGEEVYCRGYPGPDSPGWKVPAAGQGGAS